ncbi:gluconate 2-dehydrogenase subunit 3 family protein [Cupriavidus gilardii]|uniref:gluconate 2-dehydrogenase subunit 3 family protein n=2 Tax=Cupriavidus gilardii TaxID=82541 RepID=UPI001EE596B6|nr:gluconate 2-dehydrogenase subunit 3 family protein [Cupriavidus gilardii]MCG5258864.1 gluconate 2-dehydrogenase subunit 3 family protein [Cupriavidus gilardii]
MIPTWPCHASCIRCGFSRSAAMTKPFTPMRRTLLRALGAGLPAGAAATGLVRDSALAAEPRQAGASAASAGGVSHFFNARERITVDAIVARLIPNDELGPGAREAGVTDFLDRQLAGAWGSGDHFYRHGPFQAGTPEQGYQLALTPAQAFRAGLAAVDEVSARRHGGKSFAQLQPREQDALLTGLEKGEIELAALPGKVFFQMLLDGTMEGFFGDPIHGGNRNMAGWKLVGFPGVYASYSNDIERHGVAYIRPPMSIAMARASGHGAMHGTHSGTSGTASHDASHGASPAKAAPAPKGGRP